LKAPAFAYVRAESLDRVHELLAQHGAEAKLLAGGQSLMPALNMRLCAPSILIDINTVSALGGITQNGAQVVLGALTRHAALEGAPLIAERLPLLAAAVPHIAHVAIRNRGTLGGSLSFADPAAELPACCLALGASFVLSSARGERRVAAGDFFLDLYQTALADDEILLRAEIPPRQDGDHHVFMELARRHGDYATVGIALNAKIADGIVTRLRLAFFGADRTPKLAERAAARLTDCALDKSALADAKRALRDDLDPMPDVYHAADTKLHLAGVVLERALAKLPLRRA